ncbi:hypothetical protein Emin_0464 [Elusimicrobium minutum Pei191]|uniref:Uncharacterized protein n=1 Tax=Elusimicrobium minutum (strain Pei191) TaxID=445932 RepID=B2KBJ9_ELUMP|nr:hypothetical protein [Elusimicrobium minutum]ACC98021.1 hypothetical protein Emin_0464 [Elusimicrobium minutum Pei191]
MYAKSEGETYIIKDAGGNEVEVYRQGGYIKEAGIGGTNLIGADGNIIDGKTMKSVGVEEGFHGLGFSDPYAGLMGEYAADRNGLFTIFGSGFGSSDISANDWLKGGSNNYSDKSFMGGLYSGPLGYTGGAVSNADYLANTNGLYTTYGPQDTENSAIVLTPAGMLGTAVLIGGMLYFAKKASDDLAKGIQQSSGSGSKKGEGKQEQSSPATPPPPKMPEEPKGDKKEKKQGESSEYKDSTNKDSIENRLTNRTHKEISDTLQENGYEKSFSKDGKVEIYKKSGENISYTFRNFSTSGNKEPTLEVLKNGKIFKKIRLIQ